MYCTLLHLHTTVVLTRFFVQSHTGGDVGEYFNFLQHQFQNLHKSRT